MTQLACGRGKITGRGTVTSADGTVREFELSSETTKEQAERLNLKPSKAPQEK